MKAEVDFSGYWGGAGIQARILDKMDRMRGKQQ